jgi:hypothetical protein
MKKREYTFILTEEYLNKEENVLKFYKLLADYAINHVIENDLNNH